MVSQSTTNSEQTPNKLRTNSEQATYLALEHAPREGLGVRRVLEDRRRRRRGEAAHPIHRDEGLGLVVLRSGGEWGRVWCEVEVVWPRVWRRVGESAV